MHPEGDMDICAGVHGNLSNNCGDILLKSTNVHIRVVPEEKSGEHLILPLESKNICTKVNGHPCSIVVKILQSGSTSVFIYNF